MIALNALETARFGAPFAHVEDVAAVLRDPQGFRSRLAAQQVRMVTARLPADDLAQVQKLEALGFRLMDTLVYYTRRLQDLPPLSIPSGMAFRRAVPVDATDVAAFARAAFAGYLGHYHQDPQLDRAACDAIYPDWAQRSVLAATDATPVFLAEDAAGPAGFMTLKSLSDRRGELVLAAVAPARQGRGIYDALCRQALHAARDMGHTDIDMSTQLTNYKVQGVWSRLGCRLCRAYYTLHLWP
jgi:ribosomal protein S18 acetylase RimI-like enzyme